jgi:lysosomal Pro-X carboxypeptidase
MILPIAQNGITDMFLPMMWDSDAFVASCVKNQGVNPQFNWALDTFGGRNIQKDFLWLSNVIFSNGALDPWRAGGVTKKFNNDATNLVILIPKSAHHLDLRDTNAADPAELTAARDQEIAHIKMWIADYNPTTTPI